MKTSGFTLLELVVALAVFAVMAGMAYAGLGATFFARSALEEESERWRHLQLTVASLDRDLRHVVARGIRDETAASAPSLQGRANWLDLTRAGWANPAGLPRASLQRVSYQFQDDQLQRMAWPVLDRVRGNEPQVTELQDQLSRFQIRYLHEGQWLDQWPPLAAGPATQGHGLPEALVVVMQHKQAGRIERLYQLAARPTDKP